MHILSGVVGYLTDVADWVDYISQVCYELPVLGPYLGIPLGYAGECLRSVVDAVDTVGYWLQDLASVAVDAYEWTLMIYEYVGAVVVPFIDNITLTVTDVYTYAYGTLTAYATGAYELANGLASYVYGTLYALVEEAYSKASQAYAYVTDVWAGLGPAVWAYLTAGTLQNWIESWFLTARDTIVEMVKDSLGYLITEGFDTLKNSWSSFEGQFAWLLGKLIVLMTDQAAHFAPALWSLLEAVLKNIQLPER